MFIKAGKGSVCHQTILTGWVALKGCFPIKSGLNNKSKTFFCENPNMNIFSNKIHILAQIVKFPTGRPSLSKRGHDLMGRLGL